MFNHRMICFNLLFATKDRLIPKASVYLNKMNLMLNATTLVSKCNLMNAFKRYTISIRTKGILSLCSDQNVTNTVLDLWPFW